MSSPLRISVMFAALILLSSTVLIRSSQAYDPCSGSNPLPGCKPRVFRITIAPGAGASLYGAAPMELCNNSTTVVEEGTIFAKGNASSWSIWDPIAGGVPPVWGPLQPESPGGGSCMDFNWTIRVPGSQAAGHYEVTWEVSCHFFNPTTGVQGHCAPSTYDWSIVEAYVISTKANTIPKPPNTLSLCTDPYYSPFHPNVWFSCVAILGQNGWTYLLSIGIIGSSVTVWYRWNKSKGKWEKTAPPP